MSKYRVVFATRTSFDFKPSVNKYKFDLGIYKVVLRRIINEVDKELSGIKYGFFIEIELDEVDIYKSIKRAYDISELFLSMACLETGVESHRSTPILAYDITKGISDRDFVQYFYDFPLSRPHQTDLEIYTLHLEALLINSKQTDRINRSIRWFRKAVNEDDPLDQFLGFWQGLETLNPILAAHYNCENSGRKIIEKKCVNTGDLFYSEITTKQGLEKLCTEVGVDEIIWKMIGRTRNSISHGYASFESLYNESVQLTPYIAKMLHEGIFLVLGFESDKRIAKHLEGISPIKVGESIFFEGRLHEEELSKLAINYEYPYFKVKFEVEKSQEGEMLKEYYNVKQDLIPVVGCNYSASALTVSGRGVNVELESVE